MISVKYFNNRHNLFYGAGLKIGFILYRRLCKLIFFYGSVGKPSGNNR